MLLQDMETVSESFLYVEGRLVKNSGVTAALNVELVNNAMAFLFEEIHYELAFAVVDHHTRYVGVTSTIKLFYRSTTTDVTQWKMQVGWLQP